MVKPSTESSRASAASIAHELNQPIGISANLLRGLRSRLARRGAGLEADEAAALDRAIDQMMLAARLVGRIHALIGGDDRSPVQPT